MKWLLALVVTCTGCMALPPSSMERLSQTAHELNAATRFGRMDIAADGVVAEAKSDFGRRHRSWGREVRIVDLEIEGVQMLTPDTAEVDLVVSWHRIDSPMIQTTSVAQRWAQTASDWRLAEERISAGPAGLFPPKRPRDSAEARPSDPRGDLVGSVDLP